MPHTWESDAELLADFQRDVIAKASTKLTMAVRLDEAWALLGNLQLALAHPANVGDSACLVHDFTRRLAELVAQTPAEQEVARRGWQRRPELPADIARNQVIDLLREIERATETQGTDWGMPHVAELARRAINALMLRQPEAEAL